MVALPQEKKECGGEAIASVMAAASSSSCREKLPTLFSSSSSSSPPCSCATSNRCVNRCAGHGKVCPCAARVAAQKVVEAIEKLSVDSLVFPQGITPKFTFLDPDDVVIGQKLGCGGFSIVSQCVITAGEEAGQEFAIKYLRKQVMVDHDTFRHGAQDLAVESYFLHYLDHTNIIKLHGLASGSVEKNFASGQERGFFIVIDLLKDTLDHRIERWAQEQEKHGGLLSRWSSDYKERKRNELIERLRLAYTIADVMEYLHSLNIVYRDLKPDNVGFDRNGVLKLFDFGLAKELKTKDEKLDGTYELTGNTGSRRYMAPEIGKELSYNKSVDVYSFGILLWEMCSAEKPFNGYSSGKHMELVVMGGERPRMDSQHTAHWPVNLQWLMTHCWSNSPSDRPSFTIIKKALCDILECKCREEPQRSPAGSTVVLSEDDHSPRSGMLGSILHPISRRKDAPRFAKPERAQRSKTWGFEVNKY